MLAVKNLPNSARAMLFSHCDLAVKPSHSTYPFKLASLFLLGVVIVEELKLLIDMSQYIRDDIILILERWHLWECAPVEPTTIVHKTISSSVLVYLLEHYVKHRKSITLLNDNHEGNVHYLFCLICPFAFHCVWFINRDGSQTLIIRSCHQASELTITYWKQLYAIHVIGGMQTRLWCVQVGFSPQFVIVNLWLGF